MSGAEVIAVVGVISNVISTINFCKEVVAETVSLRRNSKDIPQAYKSLQVVLPWVALTLKKTQDRVEKGEMDDETVKCLRPVLDGCRLKLKELEEVFREMKADEKAGRVRLFFKSAANLTHKEKVNGLANDIMRYHHMIYQAGAVPLSSDEVSGIVQKLGTKMDGLEELVKELKTKQPMPSSISLGSASANSQNFQSTSNSNNTTLYGPTQIINHYNLIHAQVVGTLQTEDGTIPRVVEGAKLKEYYQPSEKLRLPLKKQTSRPAPAALQFESPRLDSLALTSSVPTIELDPDAQRSGSTYSSRLPPPSNDSERLEDALRDIRSGFEDMKEYPGISRERYHKAIKTLNSLSEKDDSVAFRKFHYLTKAEIGLSQVEHPPTSHLTKARVHNESAFVAAARTAFPGDSSRAKLDKAHIKARTARYQESSGLASKSIVRGMNHEAFEFYSKSAAEMKPNCKTMDDFDTLAQALLGCGRMSKKVRAHGLNRLSGSFMGHNMKSNIEPPETYLQEALRAVEEGLLVGRQQGESDEALDELSAIGTLVRSSMGMSEIG